MHELLPHNDARAWLDTGVWRGVTNGLPVVRWVPILDTGRELVMPLLAALAADGIAAHAQELHRLRPAGAGRAAAWRIWVDATAHARAEDVLRSELSHRRDDTRCGEFHPNRESADG
jgi:hypothetical protein